jgi:hypothetical protein
VKKIGSPRWIILSLTTKTDHPPEEEDYVFVEFSQKKLEYFVGKILTEHHCDAGYVVSYLMRNGEAGGTKFVFPTVPNID